MTSSVDLFITGTGPRRGKYEIDGSLAVALMALNGETISVDGRYTQLNVIKQLDIDAETRAVKLTITIGLTDLGQP